MTTLSGRSLPACIPGPVLGLSLFVNATNAFDDVVHERVDHTHGTVKLAIRKIL